MHNIIFTAAVLLLHLAGTGTALDGEYSTVEKECQDGDGISCGNCKGYRLTATLNDSNGMARFEVSCLRCLVGEPGNTPLVYEWNNTKTGASRPSIELRTKCAFPNLASLISIGIGSFFGVIFCCALIYCIVYRIRRQIKKKKTVVPGLMQLNIPRIKKEILAKSIAISVGKNDKKSPVPAKKRKFRLRPNLRLKDSVHQPEVSTDRPVTIDKSAAQNALISNTVNYR